MTNRADPAKARAWLPESAAPPRLIVCEPDGRWALALRRYWDGVVGRLCETRSLAECWDELRRAPASFVIVEVTPGNVDALAQKVARLERECPLARLAAVVDRRWADFEWPLREAGAVHVVTSPREAARLADIARRHLAQLPRPRQTVAERIWTALPWGNAAGH